MPAPDLPCLSLAIAPLKASGHFAIHIIRAPYPGGYVLNDSHWPSGLAQLWQGWQEMFSTRTLPAVPRVSQVHGPLPEVSLPVGIPENPMGPPIGRAGRLMQTLGMGLWQWLFEGSIQNSLNHSQGIAMGQNKPLRLRLEVRDPEMISIPWEIMQDGAGKQAVSLSQQVLFSRTTSDVSQLAPLRSDSSLKILLVLGQNVLPAPGAIAATETLQALKLEQEATALAHLLRSAASVSRGYPEHSCQVDTLVQPTPADLIEALETRAYNVLFYAGHGMPAPDGGLLFLRPEMTLNGTELAQVLTRCQVKLAVFNACWGAQPDHQAGGWSDAGVATNVQAIPRSSLAEVLIHHGVPAVLAMRDSITDEEALSFIQIFARALTDRLPIDQAVAVARQQLLTLYKFNQQAWTLPVLYMHPQFEGELLKPLEQNLTQLPGLTTRVGQQMPMASLRSLRTAKVWPIHGGIMRVGRDKSENDLVLQEDQGGVSRKHAVIFCRHAQMSDRATPIYFLEDLSTFGTWISQAEGWHKVHREEIALASGTQIKFGSSQNEVVEFMIHEN
jgi:CHAT domain/FHA domain